VVLRALPLTQWAMKEFEIAVWRQEPSIVSGELTSHGNELRGEICLPPGHVLEDATLIWRRGAMRIGRLAGIWRPAAAERESLVAFLTEMASGWPAGGEEGEGAAPALVDDVMRASLGALLWGWEQRFMLAQSQFAALPATADQPALALGLSLEQWWNTQPRRRREDLSDIIREGGVVLFGRLHGAPPVPCATGQNFASEGIVILRAVFLPLPQAEGGGIWRDNLYSPSFQE